MHTFDDILRYNVSMEIITIITVKPGLCSQPYHPVGRLCYTSYTQTRSHTFEIIKRIICQGHTRD